MKNDRLDFVDYCKEFIERKLEDYKGNSVESSEIAYLITEGINADGSVTYSTYEAIEFLKQWWDYVADYQEYEKDNYDIITNAFAYPEKFMVRMIIDGIDYLLQPSRQIFNDKKIKLTDKNIKLILKSVSEQDDINF